MGDMVPSQGSWRQRHLFQRDVASKANFFRETREKRQFLGAENMRKQIFDFWGFSASNNLKNRQFVAFYQQLCSIVTRSDKMADLCVKQYDV